MIEGTWYYYKVKGSLKRGFSISGMFAPVRVVSRDDTYESLFRSLQRTGIFTHHVHFGDVEMKEVKSAKKIGIVVHDANFGVPVGVVIFYR